MPGSVSCSKCSANVPEGARFCQVCGASTSGGNTPARPAAAKKPMKNQQSPKSKWTVFLAGAVIILLLSGLGIGAIMRTSNDQTASASPDHDMAAMIENAGPMPNWLTSAPKATIADYAWAASHHDQLQYFPCFCGCFNSAGHVSNSECYFQRDKGKNIAAYDGHAFG